MQNYRGYIADICKRTLYPGEIIVKDGIIRDIMHIGSVEKGAPCYLPGLTDAHIHIESSMMTPENFAKVAVTHGVVNAVCDPHEIANVLGIEGLDFMIGNARNSSFGFYFGLPSCVPSSHLETAGAVIDASAVRKYINRDDIYFLAEMMNYPGVIAQNREVMEKIAAAKNAGKKIDGHAPGLTGEDLRKYAAAGITTDHECSTIEEARERIANGIKVIVREGSAARNFENLYPVIGENPQETMLCSDDKHPDDLISGHIDSLIRRGTVYGIPVWDMLYAACITPVEHYGLPSGLMRKGDKATFIAVDNLQDFNILETIIDGNTVYSRDTGLSEKYLTTGESIKLTPNNFKARPIVPEDLHTDVSQGYAKVIIARDGEILTSSETIPAKNIQNPDIQKIIVYNRYGHGKPQIGFIKGFDIHDGAIGATIAHDSHNIVAIGSSDLYLAQIINALIQSQGGVGVNDAGATEILPLPIAGLMSHDSANAIAEKYKELDMKAKKLGCTFRAPFITMSFMALPVIPELKLTDKGLVDVTEFDFTPLISDL